MSILVPVTPEAIVDEAMSSIRDGLQLIADEICDPSKKDQRADGRKKVVAFPHCPSGSGSNLANDLGR